MEKKDSEKYNGMVIFDTPITIYNEDGEGHLIYGLIYNTIDRHNDDLWQWQLNRYITYLQAVERLTESGGRSLHETWILPSGKILPLSVGVKDFIYKNLKKSRMLYTIMESFEPYKFDDGDVDGEFIISYKALSLLTTEDTK